MRDATTTHQHTDKKALRKEREKKIALGHKEDDHEEEPDLGADHALSVGQLLPLRGGKETMRRKRPEITSVLFSYVGTDAQFDEFLKGVIHDYLAADHPYAKQETRSCGLCRI